LHGISAEILRKEIWTATVVQPSRKPIAKGYIIPTQRGKHRYFALTAQAPTLRVAMWVFLALSYKDYVAE